MQSSPEQPYMQLAVMSRWYVVSRAIQVMASLGVANYMSNNPISIEQLATATNTKPQLLDRLMRFLSAYKIFKQYPEGYSLTPLSQPLRDDDPHSMRDVLSIVDDSWWEAFAQLENNLISGEPAFNLQHQDNFFSFLNKHPEKQDKFMQGMGKLSGFDNDAISKAFNFGSLDGVVTMMSDAALGTSLINHYPNLTVSHVNRDSVITNAPNAQGYLFKGILHDFNDEGIRSLLSKLGQQMPADGKLFIAEQVIPEDSEPHTNKTMDIIMMVLLGGQQRTISEWCQVIESAGFCFNQSYPTQSLFTLMEFSRL